MTAQGSARPSYPSKEVSIASAEAFSDSAQVGKAGRSSLSPHFHLYYDPVTSLRLIQVALPLSFEP